MGKLTAACRRGDTAEIYSALRLNMAQKLEAVESGRDYAAIAKSFIDLQREIDALAAPAEPKAAAPPELKLVASRERRAARAANG